MAEHNETGQKGEQLACQHLETNGYEVLARNWRHKNTEIDIIAKHGSTLVIAEVKTRSSNFFGEPELFVNREKQRNLVKAANAYIEKNDLDLDVRFDILSVLLAGEKMKINHIQEAFYPLL
jgi:putative endonuclease